jgi:hypothetical protein
MLRNRSNSCCLSKMGCRFCGKHLIDFKLCHWDDSTKTLFSKDGYSSLVLHRTKWVIVFWEYYFGNKIQLCLELMLNETYIAKGIMQLPTTFRRYFIRI